MVDVKGWGHDVQTSKFLLINPAAMTLSQGHGEVIQYIFPDLYFLCAKY